MSDDTLDHLRAIEEAAVKLVKAKLRWKGPAFGEHTYEGVTTRHLSYSWTKAEGALYDAVKAAGLLEK